MNNLTLTTTATIVEDYTMGSNFELQKMFSKWNPVNHKYEVFGVYYDENNRRLYMPRGVDLWKIQQLLDTKHVNRIRPNDFEEIPNILLKTKPRDDPQKEALRFMVGVNEYIDNQRETQLSVNLNTGKGKTYCTVATIAILKMKSIIITGNVTLLNQWKDNIEEYTNLKDRDIMFIDGSKSINMIRYGRSRTADEAKIYLVTHATIRSYCETNGWDNLNDIFEKLGIGIKVFDEAHTNFENMEMIDFFTNVFKTYYVTATPARSDWKEDRVYKLSMKNVPSIDLFDAANDPHTEYIAIKYNSRPTPQQKSACNNRFYGLDRNKYIDYVTKQPNFYKVMRIVMELVIKCNGRVLMYIGTNEALLRVYKWIGTEYPEFVGLIGIYTSIVPTDQKLEEKEKKLLLSTTKSAGLGEHIEGLKMTIVVAEPFKSEVIARQTLGRTRDPNTLYVELVDLGFAKINDYYNYKLPIFNKYASSTSDMVLDSYELDRRSEIIEEERSKKNFPITLHDSRFFEYDDDSLYE